MMFYGLINGMSPKRSYLEHETQTFVKKKKKRIKNENRKFIGTKSHTKFLEGPNKKLIYL